MKIIKPIIGILLVAILVSSCSSNFGKKETEGNIEVYYKDGVTKEEAKSLANLLYSSDRAVQNEERKKSVQAIRRGDTVIFRMVMADPKQAAGVKEEVMWNMAAVISDSIFKNAPVNVELTDNRFKTVRTIVYKNIE
ncbi:MAG TPA: hypothetical protein VHM26_03495 [Chitinophagaceae bacterium]|jgi:hypothetical protein|nr:hypothetical protein [Chitinophagaceae bacterium]